jgi:hypothetical protein
VLVAGLLLPKEPLNLLPFAVFLSPLPMMIFLLDDLMSCKNRKTPANAEVFLLSK